MKSGREGEKEGWSEGGRKGEREEGREGRREGREGREGRKRSTQKAFHKEWSTITVHMYVGLPGA